MASRKARGAILAGASAAVIVLGAKYGAELKEARQASGEGKERAEAGPDERIAMLEARRAYLLGRRAPVEAKIRELQERQAKRAREAAPEGGQA